METLRTFGHYSIISEKIDNLPCKYDSEISLMAVSVMFFAAIFSFISSQCHALIFTGVFLIITTIGLFGGLCISDSTCGCGVKIVLKDNNYSDLTIISKSLQFTNNPDFDTLEIKTMLDDFEKYANKIDIANKKHAEEKLKSQKECCNKYKSVIQKVK